ncbi:hypothetical protein [Streptomyces sp. NPDC094468]|uniref:hypothetical protein n=1 Tax=Streptomyces sp. NPDC094468 TaxID=3366066 RepID=UPI0037F403E1
MIPENCESAHDWHHPIPGPTAGHPPEFVVTTEDGIRLEGRAEGRRRRNRNWARPAEEVAAASSDGPPDLVRAIVVRGTVCGAWTTALGLDTNPAEGAAAVDRITAEVLMLPRGERWREAVSTALAGPWCEALWTTGQLPATVLGTLKAEARALHHQLVPVWRHGTRAGRVLSLDADLGGLSLYDLVAPDLDLLAHTTDGVFADERLNRVLRRLHPAEQRVVVAYAAREGTTWTEAAAHTGAPDPKAFGDRVRRKVNRLLAEQRRRTTQRRPAPPVHDTASRPLLSARIARAAPLTPATLERVARLGAVGSSDHVAEAMCFSHMIDPRR